MKYTFVCCDIDGTIYRNDKTVSDLVIEKIKKAKESDVKIALASGRSIKGIQEVWKALGIEGYSICYNGTMVYEKDICIMENGYELEQLQELLMAMQIERIQAFLCFSNYDYMEEGMYHELLENDNTWGKHCHIIKNYEYLSLLNLHEKVYKISLHIANRKKADSFKQKVEKNGIVLAKAEDEYYDVMLAGHQKVDGVKFLSKYMKIPRERILCIGDNENDMSMLSYAGLGIAMENASSIVKKSADFVCESNEHDGVAMILSKFVL